MSSTGLEVFDRTLQATHIWLNEIGEEIGPDTQRCYRALSAVLHALRDRLPIEEASHLAAELPLLVRGVFYEGYHPSGKPEDIDTQDLFVERVAAELSDISPMDPRDAVHAVFQVLERHVSAGQLNHVRGTLPKDLQGLFTQEVQTRQ